MRSILYLLAILNVFDCIATAVGLHFQWIQEFNPFMERLYQLNPFAFISIKTSLSLVLLLLLYFNKIPNTRVVATITYAGTFMYGLVFLLHLSWLFSLIIF